MFIFFRVYNHNAILVKIILKIIDVCDKFISVKSHNKYKLSSIQQK